MRVVVCPYCQKPAALVTGAQVYPERPHLKDARFWRCVPCRAFVGCHRPHPQHNPDGTRPVGRLADPVLRKAAWEARQAFYPMWKLARISRTKAYEQLAGIMGVPPGSLPDIGDMDVEMCHKVVAAIRTYNKEQDDVGSTR